MNPENSSPISTEEKDRFHHIPSYKNRIVLSAAKWKSEGSVKSLAKLDA